MKRFYTYLLLASIAILFYTPLAGQISFSDATTTLLTSPSTYSGAPIGVADMNNDGLDDLIRLDDADELRIDYQNAPGTAFTKNVVTALSGNSWGMCIADVDHNGYNDVFTGGAYNGLKLFKANASGTAYTLSSISTPNGIFLQGANFADINNDGSADIYACHDDAESLSFKNDGTGSFSLDQSLINTGVGNENMSSGNYGSVWTDYDGDGDLDMYLSKCRQGVSSPTDTRRMNRLFQNDGSNNFTEVAVAAGLRPYAQSWAADFADIDNDGDLDCFIINHDIASQIYENNGNGTFTDVTATSGMATTIGGILGGIQCIFEDFDNDGFIDLLVTATNSSHVLYMNDGDFTFTPSSAIPSSDNIHSAACGDFNNDGFVDIFAGFGSGYNSPSSTAADKLFLNSGNSKNYFKVLLEGTTCNINAIGAKVEIFGDWGKQTREVRSGESYGIMNSFCLSFGIGSATEVDKVTITWPNGVVESICGVAANNSMTLQEGNLPDLLDSDFDFTVNDLMVDFSNVSDGIPSDYSWDFGDGNVSTDENPMHSFATAGTYTVKLTISNDCESSTISKQVEVLGALPLELLTFKAQTTRQNTVKLNWATINEERFDFFMLERSRDGRSFSTLQKVDGKGGDFETFYSAIDANPYEGSNYYRLQQVDTDGTFVYSNTIAVEVEIHNGQIKVFPNPSSDHILVSTTFTGEIQADLYDMQGNQLQSLAWEMEQFNMNVSELPPGLYFLHIRAEGRSFVTKFNKITE